MAVGTVEFDLSMVSPETGRYLTANAYTVEGVTNADGSLRELSIGQLVMAICLKRASELETQIIALMDEMNTTSAKLESLTDIETQIVNYFSNDPTDHAFRLRNNTVATGAYAGKSLKEALMAEGLITAAVNYIRDDNVLSDQDVLYSNIVTEIESKMDEKNSFSQQKMIELQSLTNKRDQSYDMISNVLKSLNTTMTGNVNNM